MLLGKSYIFSLFIISSLIIFVQSNKYRLPDNVKPRKYKLSLNPDLNAKIGNFNGSVSIVIDVLSRTRNLTLHSSNLTIDNSQTILSNKTNKFSPINHTLVGVTEFLIIDFKDDLHPGEYEIVLKFHGYLDHDKFRGFYRSSYSDAENHTTFFAATQFEPTYARRAFPCWDEPALKANFEINIKHFPNYTALSNMPIQKQMKDSLLNDGKIWTQFQQTSLLSTYNVAFTISDFKNMTNKFGNYSIWTRRNVPDNNTEFGFKVGLKALEIFEKFIDIPYSVPKVDIFLVSEIRIAGMGNLGLIILEETNFLRENNTSRSLLRKIGNNICNAVIHQWIGSLVSPAWWSDVWLTEGLSRYFQYFVLKEMKLKEITGNVRQSMQENMWNSMNIEEDQNSPALYRNISDASSVFTQVSTLYTKPPLIFNMLTTVTTKQIFNMAVREILQEYQFKSITTDQFLEILQQTVNKSITMQNWYDGFDVKAFMLPYISQVGYPILNVLRNNKNSTIKLTQECSACQENESTKLKWTIPISYTTERTLELYFSRNIYFLYPSNEMLIFPHSYMKSFEWIIINIQSLAYHRVNYDNETWQQFANYMNSMKFMNIPIANRIRLLDDASWFVCKGKLSINAFYNILSYCKREREISVWENLEFIIKRIMLHVDDNVLDVYSNLVNSVVDEVKVEKNNHEFIKDLNLSVKRLNVCRENKNSCKEVFS